MDVAFRKEECSRFPAAETSNRPFDCVRISQKYVALPRMRPVGSYRHAYYIVFHTRIVHFTHNVLPSRRPRPCRLRLDGDAPITPC